MQLLAPARWLLLLALCAGCSTLRTELEMSWRAPEAQAFTFERVVTLAVMPDSATSRRVEDQLAAHIPVGVAGYTVIEDEARASDAELKRAVAASGADGMVVVRMIDREERQRWVPGAFPSYYYSPYGYHGYRGPYYSDPGYMQVDEVYRFETNVYDVASEKLLWSGLTSTVSPKSMTSMIDELMEVVGDELRAQGLISEDEPAPAR